jgi:hypothetical protein
MVFVTILKLSGRALSLTHFLVVVVELNIVTDEGMTSAMSSDKGLRIGGRGALDEFEGSDK